MSKYGGSEKTTQAFVAAYNKPRLSTRSTEAEAPAGVLFRLLAQLPLSLDSCGPASDAGWGIGRTVPAGCYGTLVTTRVPSQGVTALFQLVVPAKTELSVPFDPVSCTRTACSFMVCTGSLAPLPLSAFFQPITGTE